jgi:WS/DGAT/MGAT family acyltransferase
MSQLSPLDGVFLAMETAETPSTIGGLAVLDPTTHPEDGFDFDAFVDFAVERLSLCPRFAWKVQEVPFGLDEPYWVEDEKLDLRRHIHRVCLPSPGDAHALSELAGHLFSMPLDRTRPLWEMYLIEGLQGGRAALLWKLHHCLMDGESGAGLLELLFDLQPAPGTRVLPPIEEFESPGPAPSLARVLLRSIEHAPRRTQALRRHLLAALSSAISSATHDAVSMVAPRAVFNGAVGARRAVAWASVPLAPLKQIKHELDVSVNDVILGLTGGAVRRYLELEGEACEQTLYAMMPVSTRARGDKTINNQVRDVAVDWGTDLADHVERILRISVGTRKAKRAAAKNEGAVSVLRAMAESLAPGATRMIFHASAAFADSLPLPGNCVVSNVRLADSPLYIAGAKIVSMVPMSVLAPTQGINITVVTYAGELHFGVVVDPRLCAAPWVIAEGISKSLSELQAAMDAWSADAA